MNELNARRSFAWAGRRAVLMMMLAGALALSGCQTVRDAMHMKPAVKPYVGERYKVGVSDWMILKRQTPGAFKWTHDIGADGVEVDMGVLSKNVTFQSKLGDEKAQQQWKDEAKKYNLEICSIAMSGLYGQNIATREHYKEPLTDAIKTAKAMGVKVIFMPLGGSDLEKTPSNMDKIIERLKEVAPMAEEAGVIIGLDMHNPAEEQVEILNKIGSPNVQIYYNFTHAFEITKEKMESFVRRDLVHELKTLGRDRICAIHCTREDKYRLEQDPHLDLKAAKQALDEMGWSGWLVLERSREQGHGREVLYNFGSNAKYVKSIFQGKATDDAKAGEPAKASVAGEFHE